MTQAIRNLCIPIMCIPLLLVACDDSTELTTEQDATDGQLSADRDPVLPELSDESQDTEPTDHSLPGNRILPLDEMTSVASVSEDSNDAASSLQVQKAFFPDAARRLVVVLCDGFADNGYIRYLWNTAYGYALQRGFVQELKGSYMEHGNDYDDVKSEIRRLVSAYAAEGIPQSQLTLLVIGKSLGAAKNFELMYHNYNDSHNGYFKNFYKVGWVLIDPHEPVAPGDRGRCNRWYDHVYFDCNKAYNDDIMNDYNDYYNLAMFSRWKYWISRGQLRVNSTFQRRDSTKGYPMCGGSPAGNSPSSWYTCALWKQTAMNHDQIDLSCGSARLIYKTLKWTTENKTNWTPHSSTSTMYATVSGTMLHWDANCNYN